MNHFHFGTDRVVETSQFYEKYFGFSKILELGSTLVLRNAKDFILAIDPLERGASNPCENSALHLGFVLKDRSEVNRVFDLMRDEKLGSLGSLLSPTPKVLHFYCNDPAGNRLEIGWYSF